MLKCCNASYGSWCAIPYHLELCAWALLCDMIVCRYLQQWLSGWLCKLPAWHLLYLSIQSTTAVCSRLLESRNGRYRGVLNKRPSAWKHPTPFLMILLFACTCFILTNGFPVVAPTHDTWPVNSKRPCMACTRETTYVTMLLVSTILDVP